MTPQFAVELPTQRVDPPGEFVSGDGIAEIAVAAEAAGFGACFVTDHPAPDGRWLDGGGHHALDPFVALSFAAAATTRLRLLTYVYVAAYRNPFLSAKAVQSLDVLSGGRFILGTAAGYLKPEFAALGVDFDERNDLLDEALDVMKAVWTGDDTAYEGRHFTARGVRVRPTPQASPHPPIWIGGNSRRAIRRAVSGHDGWAPFDTTGGYGKFSRTAEIGGVDDLAERIAYARDVADEVGREAPLDICYSVGAASSVDERHDHIGRLAELGVTWLTVGIPGDDRAAVIDGMAAFGEEFVP
jgi:probable F420-dependent oxidoreductase